MDLPVRLMLAAAVISLLSLPLVLRQVPMNRFYGLRTRKTLSNAETWYAANVFAGIALLIAGCFAVTLLVLVRNSATPDSVWALVAFLGPYLTALVAIVRLAPATRV